MCFLYNCKFAFFATSSQCQAKCITQPRAPRYTTVNGILHVAGMRSGKNHIVQADSLSRYPFGLASAEPNEMCQRRVCNENLADRARNCSFRKRAGNEIYHSAYTSGMLFAIIWARIFRTSSHSNGKCYAKFHGNVKKAIAKNCNDPRTPHRLEHSMGGIRVKNTMLVNVWVTEPLTSVVTIQEPHTVSTT